MQNDLYKEHSFHTNWVNNCSTCFKEKKARREWANRMREELGQGLGYSILEDNNRINRNNPYTNAE